MTLILSLQNHEFTIQLSDRRISWLRLGRFFGAVSDETNKAGVIVTADARFTYGYSGIARIDSEQTAEWVRRLLLKSAEPDFTAINLIKRFSAKATQYFEESAKLKATSRSTVNLSVSFAGHLSTVASPQAFFSIVTNSSQEANFEFQQPNGQNGFKFQIWREDLNSKEQFSSVQRIGQWYALGEANEELLDSMLKTKKPELAIRNKALDLVSKIGTSRLFPTIGRQWSAISIPSARGEAINFAYRSGIKRREMNFPDILIATGKGNHFWSTLGISNADGSNVIVPKTKSKWPCPCGSGKKFKYCCGKVKSYR